MRRLSAVLCLFALGCASIRDAWDQDILYLKMCAEAEKAWDIYEPDDADDMPHDKDYEKGFMDGYVAVAFGANGCPPTLPSRDYWHPRFRDEEGKVRIATWYNGYAAGAYAALANGVQDRNRIPTAGELYGKSHYPRTDAVGTAVVPAAPGLDVMPPEPLPEPEAIPATPPPPELIPQPPAMGAWRPTPAEPSPLTAVSAIHIEASVETADLEPEYDPEVQAAAELSGTFGLSRP